jgi:hypothetical protein
MKLQPNDIMEKGDIITNIDTGNKLIVDGWSGERVFSLNNGSDYELFIVERPDDPSDSLRAQRDELLAALNKIVHDHRTQAGYSGDWHAMFDWAQDTARAAIAHVEEQK